MKHEYQREYQRVCHICHERLVLEIDPGHSVLERMEDMGWAAEVETRPSGQLIGWYFCPIHNTEEHRTAWHVAQALKP